MKRTKNEKNLKPYWEMDARELAEATKEYDGPIPQSEFRPMTRAERAKFERMQRQSSRSIFIKRPKTREVTVKLDETLVERCSDYASKHDMTLSEVVAMSLKSSFVFAQ